MENHISDPWMIKGKNAVKNIEENKASAWYTIFFQCRWYDYIRQSSIPLPLLLSNPLITWSYVSFFISRALTLGLHITQDLRTKVSTDTYAMCSVLTELLYEPPRCSAEHVEILFRVNVHVHTVIRGKKFWVKYFLDIFASAREIPREFGSIGSFHCVS